jgi:uncharacterized protein
VIRAKLMAVTELQQLLAIQDLDTKADQHRYRKAHLTEQAALAATDSALASLDAASQVADQEMVGLNDRLAALEATITTMRAKESVLAAQLAKSIVPKEAETLQAEIQGLHQRRTAAEDDELEVMEAAETVEGRLAGLAAQRAPLAAQRMQEHAAYLAASDGLNEQLASLVEQRTAAAAAVSASLLTRYEKMRAHLGGVAVARLDHGTCLGCNMKLSSTEREALHAAALDAHVECEQCGRLLVR